MATTETLETTPTSFENCLSCGAAMAEDQRYCLNCGVRRGETRLPFAQVMASSGGAAGAPPAGTAPAAAPPPRDPNQAPAIAITWPVAAGGAALLLLALGVGVLIGHGTASNGKAASGTPQVITVGGGATGASGAAATADTGTFKSDWPSGKTGWTVQIQSLSKDSAQPANVAAAKSADAGKGAKDVGALDSDDYPSLSGGLYVVYSGVYNSKKDAQAALGGLKKSFPNATVIQVSDSGGSSGSGSGGGKSVKGSTSKQALQNLDKLSPKDYQKQSQKLPDKITTPGKQAPIDKSKPVGGGSDSQTIQ
jgi:hypothetical protein